MSLTKKDLSKELIEKLNINPIVAANIVNNFFNSIKKALANGEDVKLSGFGNFILNEKVERPGRNPRTGKSHIIAARRVVTFKAGTKLKSIVNK